MPAAVALSLLLAAAAPPTPQPPSFSSALDMVNVTVTVRDAHGKLVTDLQADDFIVKEDGRPQVVEVFARAHEPGQDELGSHQLPPGLRHRQLAQVLSARRAALCPLHAQRQFADAAI